MEALASSSSVASVAQLRARVPKSASPATRQPIPAVCAQRRRTRVQASAESNKERSAASFALTAASVAAVASSAGPASALDASDIISALPKVVETGVSIFDTVKGVTGTAIDTASPYVQAAAPYVQSAATEAIKFGGPLAEQAFKEGGKLLGEAGKLAQNYLSSNGYDAQPVIKTASSVAGTATEVASQALVAGTPVAQSLLQTVLQSDLTTLAVEGSGVVLALFLTPKVLSGLLGLTRGFAGTVTAPQALDALTKDKVYLIDVRTEDEKRRSGVPKLPRGAQNKLVNVEADQIDDRKLRGSLRNVKNVEVKIAAIKIASLKTLNPNTKIFLLDRNNDTARDVAKALAGLGFKKVYPIQGGFEGGNGWLQSNLGSEAASITRSEVISPARVLSGTTGLNLGGTRNNSVIDAEVVPRKKPLSLPGA
eukprot:jgi/Chlat1/2258/Chrsp17S02570